MDLRSVYASERAHSEELAQTLVELEETYEATVRGLAIAVESKDEYTGGHLFRVAATAWHSPPSSRPSTPMTRSSNTASSSTTSASWPCPTPCSPRRAPHRDRVGADPRPSRRRVATSSPRIPFLAGASEIVYAHHERWDGSGFPRAWPATRSRSGPASSPWPTPLTP